VSRFRMALTGLAMAAGLLIPAGVAQAAPSAPAAAPTHQAAAVPGASALAIKTITGTVRVINASAAGGSYAGCPYGDACMYTNSGFGNGTPEHKYYYYGCYDLSNEYGNRWIVNNQSGGATVKGYYNYGCTNRAWTLPAGELNEYNITPINSISLQA